MSAQRTEALLSTIDAHIAELAKVKAERDELREALKFVLTTPGMIKGRVEAEAILKRTTKPK